MGALSGGNASANAVSAGAACVVAVATASQPIFATQLMNALSYKMLKH